MLSMIALFSPLGDDDIPNDAQVCGICKDGVAALGIALSITMSSSAEPTSTQVTAQNVVAQLGALTVWKT